MGRALKSSEMFCVSSAGSFVCPGVSGFRTRYVIWFGLGWARFLGGAATWVGQIAVVMNKLVCNSVDLRVQVRYSHSLSAFRVPSSVKSK